MVRVKLIHLDKASSTNDVAFSLGEKGEREIVVVIARQQTHGRGRFNRRWASPKDKGIYASLLLRPPTTQKFSLLPLVGALSVIRTLKDIIPLTIKWPNDLLVRGKKIGGLLSQSKVSYKRIDFVILGLGVNINSKSSELPENATSLFIETGKFYSIESILKAVVSNFLILYRSFKKGNVKDIIKELEVYMETLHREVAVSIDSRSIRGIALYLTDEGNLVIRNDKGELTKISALEVIHLR
ncbi:MAG: biotin--[acetyl-CoA-carboxylase] ligase [Candidatus Omnitrophica bacterium]|nr:biotin--[acetyl-CoA-carboxylase] ligase [Candidatus Omnitrophota bacterium]